MSVENSVLSIAIGSIEIGTARPKHLTAEELLMATAPRRYHPALDVTLNNADLNALQVLQAWKNRALGGRDGKLVRQHTTLDYLACVIFLVPLLLYLVVLFWGLITSELSLLSATQCAGALAILILCISLVLRQHFWPQRTAKKALQAVEQHSAVRAD